MPFRLSSPSTTVISDAAPSVLVFLHGFGPGGVERIALRLITGWRAAGVAVRLIVGEDDGPMRAELGEAAAYATAGAWPFLGHRWRVLRLIAAAYRAVQAQRPDILFCPGNSYTIVAVALKLLLGRDCPPIVAKVSNDLDRRDMRSPARWCYYLWLRLQGQLIDRFAVLSEPMAAEAMARFRVSARRVQVVPNPVIALNDIVPPAAARAPSAGRRFVAIGRLERQKDYPLMLRAFAMGHGPGDTLTVLGEGAARHDLGLLAVDLGIAGHVRFPGFCRDVPAALRDHDVLLLSSQFEGVPGAVIEALARGMAIVATDCSASMPALLDRGALGTLVPVGDRAAFADAIRTVQRGAQNVERAQGKARTFTIEAAVPAYLALFARVAALRRARHSMPAMPFELSLS